jgi:hypothetical protein
LCRYFSNIGSYGGGIMPKSRQEPRNMLYTMSERRTGLFSGAAAAVVAHNAEARRAGIKLPIMQRPGGPEENRPGRQAGIKLPAAMSAEGAALSALHVPHFGDIHHPGLTYGLFSEISRCISDGFSGMLLILGDVTDAGFSKKNSRAAGRKPYAEAMAVVVADMPAQALSVFKHDRHFCMGIHKGFQIQGFGSRIFRMDQVFTPQSPIRLPRIISSF